MKLFIKSMKKFYYEIYFSTNDDKGSVIIKFLHITVSVGNEEINFAMPITLF
jgi:hypothetical protein